jgi:cytochrome c oxidase assembly protein subunit 15
MQPQQRLLWFRRVALLGALLAAAVVVLGAWVRLTAAGLGCPDWPGCYGHAYPQTTHEFGKALHEMIHRYAVLALGTVIVTLAAWAVVNRRDRGQPLIPALLLLVIVLLQAALGAFTVTLRLNPLIVTSHLVGGLSTLGLLWWLSRDPEHRELTDAERPLRVFTAVGLVVMVMQILLGGWTSTNYAGVACPDFPTCQRAWWPDMDYRDAFVLWRGQGIEYEGGVLPNAARVAIHFTHRLGALVAGSVLISLGLFAAARARRPRLRIAGLLLTGAVVLQIAIGIATVHWGLPLPLATLHNAGAAFLVVAMVTLVRAVWPSPTLSMVPLGRVNRTR